MISRKEGIIAEIQAELYNDNAKPLKDLTEEKNAYYTYIFNMLSDTSYGNNVIPKEKTASKHQTKENIYIINV